MRFLNFVFRCHWESTAHPLSHRVARHKAAPAPFYQETKVFGQFYVDEEAAKIIDVTEKKPETQSLPCWSV